MPPARLAACSCRLLHHVDMSAAHLIEDDQPISPTAFSAAAVRQLWLSKESTLIAASPPWSLVQPGGKHQDLSLQNLAPRWLTQSTSTWLGTSSRPVPGRLSRVCSLTRTSPTWRWLARATSSSPRTKWFWARAARSSGKFFWRTGTSIPWFTWRASNLKISSWSWSLYTSVRLK